MVVDYGRSLELCSNVSTEMPRKAKSKVAAVPCQIMDGIVVPRNKVDVKNGGTICRKWRRKDILLEEDEGRMFRENKSTRMQDAKLVAENVHKTSQYSSQR